jgi:hypothetical protein
MRLIIISFVFILSSAQSPIIHNVYNCGNPDGLVVHETGRIIQYGEVFEMIGDEAVNANGVSTITVFDGTIEGNDLFICNKEQ